MDSDQEDLISIGTIGLIKAVTTFDTSKGARLATYAARCVENEILMYFRSMRKSAQDVSLSDYIETGADGAALSLMDVVSEDTDLLEQFLDSGFSKETAAKMINSALIMKEQDGMFSTVDICAIDLYTGICNFLASWTAICSSV